MNLLRWLRRMPQPVAVMADDTRVEVTNRSARGWSELNHTLDALAPVRVSCLAEDGAVIRSRLIVENEPEELTEAKPRTGDTEIQVFAKLIAEAYQHAQKSPLLDNAMQFIERQAQRIVHLERELERLRVAYLKLQSEIVAAPAEGEGGNELVAGIVTGMLQAAGGAVQPQQPQQQPPNGGKKR